MTSLNLSNSISSRKEKLLLQISQSLTIEKSKELDLLQFQWAHRYGVESVPHLDQLKIPISDSSNTFESELDDEPESLSLYDEQLTPEYDSRVTKNRNSLEDNKREQNNFQLSRKELGFKTSVSTKPPSPSLDNLRRWLSNK